MGFNEYNISGSLSTPAIAEQPAPYEKLILGTLMFIPGSYHVVIAVLAYFQVEGYKYTDVASFENDDWWNDHIE